MPPDQPADKPRVPGVIIHIPLSSFSADTDVGKAAVAMVGSVLESKINSGNIEVKMIAEHKIGNVCEDIKCEVSYVLLETAFPDPASVTFVVAIRHHSSIGSGCCIVGLYGPFPDDHRLADGRRSIIEAFDSGRPTMNANASLSRAKAESERAKASGVVGPIPNSN